MLSTDPFTPVNAAAASPSRRVALGAAQATAQLAGSGSGQSST